MCEQNVDAYHLYGGRGIAVCAEWSRFEAFYEWAIKSGYQDDLSIDRKDNDKGYSPENCQWSNDFEQARNKRTTKVTMEIARNIRKLRADGVKNKDIAEMFNITRATVSDITGHRTWAESERRLLKAPPLYIEYNGQKKLAHEWSKDHRVSVAASTIHSRKKSGMSDYDALFSPKKTHNKIAELKRQP